MPIDRIVKGILIIGVAGLVGAVSYVGFVSARRIYRQAIISEEYNRLYPQAIDRWADTNKDGFIPQAEIDTFNKDLLKDKGVTLKVGEMPKYPDGTPVPQELIVKWLKEYKPSE